MSASILETNGSVVPLVDERPVALPRIQTTEESIDVTDFHSIYDCWFDTVHRWVTSLGGPVGDTEDLVQEVFIVVQRRLRSFDGANLAGWLYTISEHAVRDARRRAWFRNLYRRPREVALEDFATTADNPEAALVAARDRARFYAIVDRMNGKWREAFVLFEVEGYSGEEIAALRRMPVATVRTHLHRARKQFEQLLGKQVRP
jgi:RNA polymerase sigma-70 factor (ECF subfamily)